MSGSISRWDRMLLGVKQHARRRGIELTRFNAVNSFDLQRSLLLRHLGVDLVLDVGAAVGDYARDLRAAGYGGQIVSFEPLAGPFAQLAAAAAGDERWMAIQAALSDAPGEAEINVAANLSSSSLLAMEDRHTQVAPHSRYVRTERVERRRLDDVDLPAASRLMLKVDVQGSERAVLAGGRSRMADVVLAELELSLVPLYSGGPLFPEMLEEMAASGFRLAGARTALADEASGEAVQLDGLFVRS